MLPRIGEKIRQKNALQVNTVKKAARIIKIETSFEKILYTVANLQSKTKNTEDSTNYAFQGILDLPSETTKEDFFHLGRKISDLTVLKKRMVAV